MAGQVTVEGLAEATPIRCGARDLLSSVQGISVADVMRPELVTCPAGASLLEVAQLMAASGAHAVVVWGDKEDVEGIWGVVSDADFIAAASEGVRTAASAVGVAGGRVVRVGVDDSLAAAAMMMHVNAVTQVVVVSADGRPVGILSAHDVACAASRVTG